MKLEKYNIITPAREIKRIVLNRLTSRFPNEACLYAVRGDFQLKHLENGLARAEKFQSEQKVRSASSHALAVAHVGGGQTGTGGGARGRGRQGRHLGGRHDDGRGRNQQQGHRRQMHPGQQHQPPAVMPRPNATTVARMAAPAPAPAPAAISAVTTAATAAPAVQPLKQLGENTSPSSTQPLEQLGKTTFPTVARKSTSPAKITTSRRRSVTPAARHVSVVRRGGALPRRLRDNYARTNATASSICGIIFRSPCRAVRHLPPSPLDIVRQR